MQDKKIILVNQLFIPYERMGGGVEKTIKGLVNSINNIKLIISTDPFNRHDSYMWHGVSIRYLKLRNIYNAYTGQDHSLIQKFIFHSLNNLNVLSMLDSWRILNCMKGDILQTHSLVGISPTIWLPAKLNKMEIIHVVHDFQMMCPSTFMYKNQRNCERQCIECKILTLGRRQLSSLVDKVVYVSEFMKNKHEELGYFKNAKPFTIYNGIEIFEEENRLPSDVLRVGFIGRLVEHKGILDFISVAKKLSEHSDISFLAAGDGSEDIIGMLNSQTNIEYVGYKSEAKEFYDNIDILIVPSKWNEPFGRIIIEAYAKGIIVLSSDRGAFPEIVKNNETGFICDSVEVYASRITQLAKDPIILKQMSLNAKSFAKNFDLSVQVDLYQKMYEFHE